MKSKHKLAYQLAIILMIVSTVKVLPSEEPDSFQGTLRFFAWDFPQREIFFLSSPLEISHIPLSNVGFSRRFQYNGKRNLDLFLSDTPNRDEEEGAFIPDFTTFIPADRGNHLVMLLPEGSHSHRILVMPEPDIRNNLSYQWFNLTRKTIGVSWAGNQMRLAPMTHATSETRTSEASIPVEAWDLDAQVSTRLFSGRWAVEEDKSTCIFLFEDHSTGRIEIRRIELPAIP